MDRSIVYWAAVALMAATAVGCGGSREQVATGTSLELDRVVLYRNGIGYFERAGQLEGDVLKIKCRKDQINDILKSLTVVDRSTGQAVSVSMPLDPQTWANAALATLAPGGGDLADVLDALRGTRVSVGSGTRIITGRILMVEYIEHEDENGQAESDNRLVLIENQNAYTVLLSEVDRLTFKDEEIAIQLNRSLDASAGEGMFQQVTVEVQLIGENAHDLTISYVVPAPIWKPTYRVVLPEDPNGEALLQAWAVVDNTTGEDWFDVDMSLTSGSPIAFKYDLHTPRVLERPDMTHTGTSRRARAAVGDTAIAPSWDKAPPAPSAKPAPNRMAKKKDKAGYGMGMRGAGRGGGGLAGLDNDYDGFADDEMAEPMEEMEEERAMDIGNIRNSTNVNVRSRQVSGQTLYEIENRVTVPDGTSTMVAILNETIEAEQTFLYRPGGSGPGFENNPYRVVRFKNSTPFVLEPGPISIYAGGNFVGEGIADIIAAGSSATIPFSVEPSITVTSDSGYSRSASRLLSINKGVMRVENFQRRVTTWKVRAKASDKPYRVFVRQSSAGSSYELQERPEGTEDLNGAYLIPIEIPAGETEVTLKITEQTPSRSSLAIWDYGATKVLENILLVENLDDAGRKQIEPIVKARKAIADIDVRINNLRKQKRELDQRADQTRANLNAIAKDNRAGDLRKRLTKRLDEFSKEGDALGREIVELTSKRLEKKIELEEMLDNFTFTAPKPPKKEEEKKSEDKG